MAEQYIFVGCAQGRFATDNGAKQEFANMFVVAPVSEYLSKVVSELNGFGTDVDTALAYLNGISQNSATMVQALNTVISLLSATNSDIRQILLELLEMDVDADTIVKHLTSIATNCKNMDNDMDAIQSYLKDQVTYLKNINRWLSDSYDLLDGISSYFDDTVSYLISIDGSLGSLSQYLDTLDTYLSSIATNSETTGTWLEEIYNTLLTLDTGADSAAAALEYLTNMDNSLVFISQSLAKLEELTGTSNESLREVVSYLVSIDASGASAAAYLQYININVADIKDNTDAILLNNPHSGSIFCSTRKIDTINIFDHIPHKKSSVLPETFEIKNRIKNLIVCHIL